MSGTVSGAAKRALGLTGQRFGRWSTISRRGGAWLCRCDCGQERLVLTSNLRGGKSRSCGCLSEELKLLRIKHGAAARGRRSPEYGTWVDMQTRCLNANATKYKDYGGRGIAIVSEWLGPGGFERFLAHVGLKPSRAHSIDRINNDGNYEPGNVRWATKKEQANNRRPRRKRTA